MAAQSAVLTNQENLHVRPAAKLKVPRCPLEDVGNKLQLVGTSSYVVPSNQASISRVRNDPFLATEYASDIFNHLRVLEISYAVREDFLVGNETTPKMRAKLIDWLIGVHATLKLCIETLHLCVSIVDRYLQENRHVGKATLQLVGISALLVACKYEEIYVPDMAELIYICDDAYSLRQMLKMERSILRTLQFNLGKPTSIEFLRSYNRLAYATKEHHVLAKYLLEVMLLHHNICHLPPSLQAASASCLAIGIYEQVKDLRKVWSATMVCYSLYDYAELRPVMILVAQVLVNMDKFVFKMVREKYAASKYLKISLNSRLDCQLVRNLAIARK